MKIIKYTTELDDNRKVVLVKESSSNYPYLTWLNSPDNVSAVMNDVFHANKLAEEHSWIVALNVKCRPIGFFDLTHGSVNASIASVREIFVRLCLCGAVNFIYVHNHPSGDSTPSDEDRQFTKRLKEAGTFMNIPLLDHIIIGEDHFSFKENNEI